MCFRPPPPAANKFFFIPDFQSSGSLFLAVLLDLLPQTAQEGLQVCEAGGVVHDSCHFCHDDFEGCQTSAHSGE